MSPLVLVFVIEVVVVAVVVVVVVVVCVWGGGVGACVGVWACVGAWVRESAIASVWFGGWWCVCVCVREWRGV